MQKTPLLQTVTNLYRLIFNYFILHCRRSRGSSSRKSSKMYGIMASIQKIRRIFSATDFTVTTVTNYYDSFIIVIIIIELVFVTVRKKAVKRGLTVTNCYKLLQTVTSLSHSTVTNYNCLKIIHIIKLFFIKNQFVTVKHPSW